MNYMKKNKMLEQDAKTAFDIWYEWDKEKFSNSQPLTKTLKYIKENQIT